MMNRRQLRIWLRKVEKDPRINQRSADAVEKPQLALEQMGLETTSDVLRRVLGLPGAFHNPIDGTWQINDGREDGHV